MNAQVIVDVDPLQARKFFVVKGKRCVLLNVQRGVVHLGRGRLLLFVVVHNAFPSRGDCLAIEKRRKIGRYKGENARIDDDRDAASLLFTIGLVST